MSTTLSIRLPDPIAKWVEQRAALTGRSRGCIVKESIEQVMLQHDKPFMKLAGTLEGPSNL